VQQQMLDLVARAFSCRLDEYPLFLTFLFAIIAAVVVEVARTLVMKVVAYLHR
jgi:hypothetical protein